MANKFQKSVLYRLEQESQLQKDKDPQKAAMVDELISTIEKHQTQEFKEEYKKEKEKEEREKRINEKLPQLKLEQFLDLAPARQAKNKTFYLDIQVIESVKAAARKAKVTDSKLVNDILKSILHVD